MRVSSSTRATTHCFHGPLASLLPPVAGSCISLAPRGGCSWRSKRHVLDSPAIWQDTAGMSQASGGICRYCAGFLAAPCRHTALRSLSAGNMLPAPWGNAMPQARFCAFFPWSVKETTNGHYALVVQTKVLSPNPKTSCNTMMYIAIVNSSCI